MLNNKKELTVVVLAINETFSLEKVIADVSLFSFVAKILIVSPEFVTNDCLKTQNKISENNILVETIIQPIEYPGYGGAIKFSLKYIKTKYFCWLDGDGETNPAYLNKMYKVAQENKELNIINASRFKNNNIIIKDYGLLQSILTFLFQIFCKIFFGGIVTDYTVAYRMYKTKYFEKFTFESNDQNFALETILLPLLHKETKISEIYYEWTKRQEGASSNSILNKFSYFKIFFNILKKKFFKTIKF